MRVTTENPVAQSDASACIVELAMTGCPAEIELNTQRNYRS